MSILEDELEALEPVHVECTDADLEVTLANGQKIVTPLWWYPRLFNATPQQRACYELSPFGVHWPEVDEDLCPTEIVGLGIAGAEILHPHAVKVVQAFDGLVNRCAINREIAGR